MSELAVATSPIALGQFGQSQFVNLRKLLSILLLGFSLVAVGLITYCTYQYTTLSRLAQHIDSAERLGMLSQQAVLFMNSTVHGDENAHGRLLSTNVEFSDTLKQLRIDESADFGKTFVASLLQVALAWDAQETYMRLLVFSRKPTSAEQERALSKLAATTLLTAEDNVALLRPYIENKNRYVSAVVPLSFMLACIFVSVFAWIFRKRILRPLAELDQLMEQLTSGDFTARGQVRHMDEIGQLMLRSNRMAEVLETGNAKQADALSESLDSETRYRTLWEISNEAIITLDLNNIICFANPAVFNIFGYEPSALVGQDLGKLQPEHLRIPHQMGMARYIRSGVRTINWRCVETQGLHQKGYEFPIELSFTEMVLAKQRFMVGTFRDVTERKAQEAALLRGVHYDTLTGLPSRTLLLDRIEQCISNARRHDRTFGVLYLDLDNFKVINESLGHQSGDQLLCEAAKRLLLCVRDGDTVARVGGDEFVLLLAELHSPAHIDTVAKRAIDAMSKSFDMLGKEGYVGVSIGSSTFTEDANCSADLLQHSETAMYRAKEIGRNNYQRYDAQMQERFETRMSIDVQLRQALLDDQFVLHYQPQIDLMTGAIVGAEALIRWDSPILGRVSPVQFIPMAEETGLIIPIGKWVIEQACRDATGWLDSPEGVQCRVAINLSPRQFNSELLFDTIESALNEFHLAARHVELEITEGLVMQDPERANATLLRLKSLGCSVAIDDFGTGYSSLASLRSFPVDCLKIDKTLVSDFPIVRSVIQLARSFDMHTLAEGVEDADVLRTIRELGCDIVQGYFYSRPLPIEDFREFLRNPPRSLRDLADAVLKRPGDPVS